MSTRELDKVQLGSEIASHVNSARDDDSDAESAVTEEGYNSDVVYNVDYIRYAVLLDARKTKHQGKIGWYYCIAWSGYLRHKSDNEEPREQFDDSQDPDGDIQRFWKALNRKVSPSTKEPKGRIGEKVYAAESYLVSKLKDINKDGLVRSLKRLQRRNAREAAGKVIRKKDSDYYLKYNVAQRREKLLAAHAAKSKRKRVIESDDESEGDGSGASPTTRQRAASPANSLDILDSGGSDDDDDVPLAKKRKSADTSPAQKGKDDQVEAKKRKTEAKRAARQKAEQDEEEARRAAKQAELEEVERLEKIEKKRKRKEAKERLAREAAEQERLDKEEQARLAEEKRKANEKEANWGSFTKKAKTSSPAVSSGHYSPALSHAQVPIPTPPASTSASSSRKARPAPHKSLPTPAYKLAAAHPSIQVANFGEPEPGMFDDRSAKSSNKNVSLAPALSPSHSSSGSLFAADDESLVPDVPSQPHTAPAAGTGGPLLKSALKPSPQPPATTIASSGSAQGTQADPIVLSTGDDPRRVTKSALASSASPGPDAAASFTSGKQVQFASAPAHESPVPPGRPPSPSPPPITAVPPSPTSSRTLNSISPRSKPIVIDLERPLYSHEPKINVLEDPNIVRGRFGLGGPDSAKSAAPALPPTPVSSSNTYTPALSRPPPTGPRARPGPPQGPASAPIVRPLYAHTGPNAVPIGARPPTYTPLSAHTAMLQQGGMSPMRRSPNGYGGMSPGYQTVGPGASPHWQPNQPIPQTAAVQPVYSIAGDPRKRSRIVSGGSTPGSAHGLPPTPLASTLPIVPEDQPLQTNIQHPQRSLQASKVSSYQPRRTSVDHGAAGNPAKPVPVVPRDTWTASTSRGVIGTGRLILPIKQDEGDGTIPVRFITGSAITPATGDVSMVSLLNRELDVQIYTEPLEAFCLHGHLQRGAKIVEWAKVTYADEQSVRDWKRAKSYFDSGKIFAAYTESTSSLISRHYAIVFASGKQIDFAGLGIGLASWQRQDVDFGAFLVSLPLDSNRPPSLPNPVRPDFDIHQRKPEIPDDKPVSMLESYGIHQSLFDSLSGKPAQYRFSHVRTVLDNLQLGVHQGFSASGVRPNQGHDGRVEALISENARPLHTLRSSIIQSAALRRTTLYAVGTSLSLLPHQWKLRTIWSTGGLVTFSPTFMLRSPDKFAEVMQIIRPASNWAAYVLPVVIEYCNKSWDEPQRCPDSTNAFAALTKSLLLDEHLLRFSGSAATSGGGLAISTCPPSIHQADACTTWLAWLKLLYEQRDFEKLVELCKGVRAGDWESIRAAVTLNDKGLTGGFGSTTSGNGSSTAFDMDLIDIEKSQLEDLVNMRLRNDLVPYRRFVYIGEMSLSSASRESYSRNGIEYVKADDFAAIFSGAV